MVTPANSGALKFIETCVWALTSNEGHDANFQYIKIPANKFVIGVPAANGASADPLYVITPEEVQILLDNLKAKGVEPAGFMNWSADFDACEHNGANPRYTHKPWSFGKAVATALNI